MAPRSSRDVPKNQRGKFNRQRSDGTVVIDVPSGYSFVISDAKAASTGMRRLLAEGLRQNEEIFWTTRESFGEPEIDHIYCDRLEYQRRRYGWIATKVVYEADESRLPPSTLDDRADYGDRAASRLIPYDEPHPYSLDGSRDIETARRRSLYADPSLPPSYEERARRSSQAYGQHSVLEDSGPSRNTQSSLHNFPPPYSSFESLPLYTGTHRSEEEMDDGVPSRQRGNYDSHDSGRQDPSFSGHTGQ